jgi:hypothetical protein
MSSDTIEGEPSHLEAIPIFSPSMLATDISFEPILDPSESPNARTPKSHDDPINPLRHPKHRSHEDYEDDQEEPQQWLEDVKNSYAIEGMDKAETLRIQPKPDPKGELNSISLINMSHPSLEEALDKINMRVTNPREILDNKMSSECHRHGMMETMFPPVDIHEEITLEPKKEDDIDEHGSYLMNTSLIPRSHEKSLESTGLSNNATHEVFNPLILLVHKDFERVVVDAYVYHKYCKSR